MSRKICLFEACGNYTKGRGYRVCNEHSSTAALQQEIERLKILQPEGAWQVLRHPDMRRLFRLIVALDHRAQPAKGASTEVTARSRGHNTGDGIVAVGDHRVMPGYAVQSYADSGRLGAALSKVKESADHIERIADPTRRKPKDLRPRCGSRKCSQPNRRQPLDQTHCGYCGRELRSDE